MVVLGSTVDGDDGCDSWSGRARVMGGCQYGYGLTMLGMYDVWVDVACTSDGAIAGQVTVTAERGGGTACKQHKCNGMLTAGECRRQCTARRLRQARMHAQCTAHGKTGAAAILVQMRRRRLRRRHSYEQRQIRRRTAAMTAATAAAAAYGSKRRGGGGGK